MAGGGRSTSGEGGVGNYDALSRLGFQPSTVAFGGDPPYGSGSTDLSIMENQRNRFNVLNDPAPASFWNNISNYGNWGGNWNPGTATRAPFGTTSGQPNSWTTQIPTFWDSQGIPYAVPIGGWNPQGLEHQGQNIKET